MSLTNDLDKAVSEFRQATSDLNAAGDKVIAAIDNLRQVMRFHLDGSSKAVSAHQEKVFAAIEDAVKGRNNAPSL